MLKEKNKRIRKEYASKGILQFGKTYFPEYFSLQVPEVHKKIYDDLRVILEESKEFHVQHHYALALPRGTAKSTILDFLYPLYCVCFNLKRFILIVSASQELAMTFLANIKDELEFNPLLREDFGNLVGKIWNAENIETSSGIKIKALGSGNKIRGLKNKESRPDLVICDDLEDDETVRSPEQRKKLKNWYYKALSKVGDKNTDFVFLGTVLHYDSLLVDVLNNPLYNSKKYSAVIKFSEAYELWNEWERLITNMEDENRLETAKNFFAQHKEAMLEGTEVLWEAKYSYYDLMVMKVTEGDSAFNTEMQNNPLDPDNQIFLREWFQYFTLKEIKPKFKELELFAAIDASMGKKNNSDFSAIVVLAKNKKTGQMYCLECNMKRRHPDQIIDDAAEILLYWMDLIKQPFKVLGVEDVAFQSFFKDELRKRFMAKNIYVNINGLSNNQDKQLRIERLQPDIKNGYIKFLRDQKLLLEQLEYFPLAAHDDGPDALEMARRLIGRSVKLLK